MTNEDKVLAVLSVTPKHIDTITREADISPRDCSAALMMFLLEGKVRSFPGMNYALFD